MAATRPRSSKDWMHWLGPASALLATVVVGAGLTLSGWLVRRGASADAGRPELGARVAEAAAHPEPDLALAPLGGEGPSGTGRLVRVPESGTRDSFSGPAPGGASAEGRRVAEGTLRPGDTLVSSLARQGVPTSVGVWVGREMSSVFDFRYARPGHRYRLERDADGLLVSFRYRLSPLESYRLVLKDGHWVARREDVALVERVARVAGVITTTLYDAVQDLGASPQLAVDFADIFAWDLDFSRAVRPGDEFRILYERRYRVEEEGAEVYTGPGRTLAASYRGENGDHEAIYFETEEGRGAYYRPDGSSVERRFLRSPLRYGRVTSSYTAARLHPILKVRRPHFGIDYAAPQGTPVWSVADGRIVFRGRAGGFGRLVKIRHANGYVSYYAHLSRFVAGLRVGQAVRQKQLIGYVGRSGLATGPHVCFRIARNGRYVNPVALRAPAGDPIPEELRPRFQLAREELLQALGPSSLAATDEAL